MTKIVIAGGGFAGLNAAMYFDRTLARSSEADVVLISRENFILFTPMLHEVAAGDLQPSDIVSPLRRILRHVKVVEAEVDAIDLRARKVSPTAQHGLRQGVAAAKNIEAAIVGRALKPFRACAIGLLASIGHHTGVAMVFGVNFSGFIAWWLWRTVYLAKLPGLADPINPMPRCKPASPTFFRWPTGRPKVAGRKSVPGVL